MIVIWLWELKSYWWTLCHPWIEFAPLLHNKRDKFLVINPRQWLLLAKEVIKTKLQPMEKVLAMEEDMLPKFAVIMERQGIPLIHAIESMTFHLIPSLKIWTMIKVILMQFFIIHILIMMSRIMKVQSQKCSLNKLVLLLNSIKHC